MSGVRDSKTSCDCPLLTPRRNSNRDSIRACTLPKTRYNPGFAHAGWRLKGRERALIVARR